MEEKNANEKVLVELERFESTFVLPGFGRDEVAAGRVVEHVIAKTSAQGSPIHLKWVKVERGGLTLAGDCEPAKLKTAVRELSNEVADICRKARMQKAPLASVPVLPRTAEES